METDIIFDAKTIEEILRNIETDRYNAIAELLRNIEKDQYNAGYHVGYNAGYIDGYNTAKREIALSGEYERAYQRAKADAHLDINDGKASSL